jgi:hypothetical protein
MPGPGSHACPKVKPGELSLKQQREIKRIKRLLGEKGPEAERRTKKAAKVAVGERANKRAVRLRDMVCRYPECGCRTGAIRGDDAALEVAHLEDKGMGGDPLLIRSLPSTMILLCHYRHQGVEGEHSKLLEIERLTPSGTDGACAFYQRDRETGKRYLVGITEPPPPVPLEDDDI